MPPFHREIVTGIPDRLGRGMPLARFNDLPHLHEQVEMGSPTSFAAGGTGLNGS